MKSSKINENYVEYRRRFLHGLGGAMFENLGVSNAASQSSPWVNPYDFGNHHLKTHVNKIKKVYVYTYMSIERYIYTHKCIGSGLFPLLPFVAFLAFSNVRNAGERGRSAGDPSSQPCRCWDPAFCGISGNIWAKETLEYVIYIYIYVNIMRYNGINVYIYICKYNEI